LWLDSGSGAVAPSRNDGRTLAPPRPARYHGPPPHAPDPAHGPRSRRRHFQRSLATLTAAASDADFCASVAAIAAAIETAFRAGHKVMLAGNGGSAADAQHIAGEFLSRFRFDRNPCLRSHSPPTPRC